MKYGKRIKKEYRATKTEGMGEKGFAVRMRCTFPHVTEWRRMPKTFKDKSEAQEIADRLNKMTPLETEYTSQSRFIMRHGCIYCADARGYYGDTIDTDDEKPQAYYCIHKNCPYEKLMESYGGYEKYDAEMRRNRNEHKYDGLFFTRAD